MEFEAHGWFCGCVSQQDAFFWFVAMLLALDVCHAREMAPLDFENIRSHEWSFPSEAHTKLLPIVIRG